jgi:DNA-binding MarR family transcriptional regulator
MRAALKFLFARGWFDRLVPSKGKTPLEVLTQPSFTLLQGQYLAFIAAYTKVNGLAPAEADMQKFFRVSAPSVHSMVLTLERRGLIARQVGKARSIQVAVPRELLPALD